MNFDNVPVEDFEDFPDGLITQPGLRIQARAFGIEGGVFAAGVFGRRGGGVHRFPGPADGVIEEGEFDVDGMTEHFLEKVAEAAGVEAAGVVEVFGEFGIEADFQVAGREIGGPGVAQDMLKGGLHDGAMLHEVGPLFLQIVE